MMASTLLRAMIVVCGMATIAISSPSHAQSREQADLLDLRTDVLTAFRGVEPDLNFRPDPADPARILSDTISVDVTNVFNSLRAFPEEPREEVIADFVDTSLRITAMGMADLTPEELVVVLRSAEYVDYLRQSGAPFVSRRITGNLHAVVMRNSPDAFATVSLDMLPARSEGEFFEIGVSNVSTLLSDIVTEDYDGAILYFIESDPDLTSALALMPEFWDIVRGRFGDDFVFVIPRRDQLFVIDTADGDPLGYAKYVIDATFTDRYNLLSPEIYALENGKIVTVETPR